MNKAQKFAWLGLILGALMLGFVINMTIEMLSSGSHLFAVVRIWALLIIPFGTVSLVYTCRTVLLAKKQGIPKVDYDERDHLIWKKAALAAFVSLLIALAAASITPQFIVGQTGNIPAWLLPIIHFGVLIIAFIVYSAAVLIQYGWGG